MIRLLLRSIAILIAVLGAIDPALTTERTAPVTISLIDTTPPSAAAGAADAIAAALTPHHTVVRGPNADAALTIVVGDAPPPHAAAITTPAIVVVPPDGPGVAIARVLAPPRASFEELEIHTEDGVALRALLDGDGPGGRAEEAVRRALVETLLHDSRPALVAALDEVLLGVRPRAGTIAGRVVAAG